MKKVYSLLLALIVSGAAFAQIPSSDMESWRTTSAGGVAPVAVEAPFKWYGSDSLIIAMGQSFGLILGSSSSDWRKQIFKESTMIHGGSFSAKIMTRRQFTYRLPGVLTNAIPSVAISFTPPGITGVKLNGGTPIASKPTSVSAWVQYFPGNDSGTTTVGIDSGTLSVQVLGQVGGKDSVIGTGFVVIPPTSGWLQVTANIVYPIFTDVAVDTFRIALSSGKGAVGLDSSTLYADDLTMVTIPNPDHTGVNTVTGNDMVKVYPNPASNAIYFHTLSNELLSCNVYSASGRMVADKTFIGNDALDVAHLPAGLYFYTMQNESGTIVQRGKITLTK